jgi:hypothetical protein
MKLKNMGSFVRAIHEVSAEKSKTSSVLTDKEKLKMMLYLLAGTYINKVVGRESKDSKTGIQFNSNLVALNRIKSKEQPEIYNDILKFRDCNTPIYMDPADAFRFPKNENNMVPARNKKLTSADCQNYMFSTFGRETNLYRTYARNIMEPILKAKASKFIGKK